MLEALLPYYERELGYLRDLSSEFARRYPKIAGRLSLEGDQCEDPHTERLIESFAFLAARIHRKLDDEYPEIAASFLDVLYPHYLRPIPSSSIVQFECDPQRTEITAQYRVPRHEPVIAPNIEGVACKFRTCYAVDLYPLSVTSARLELTSGSERLRSLAPDAAAVLTLELDAHANLEISKVGLESLRFFLDGEAALMHLLYELLLSRIVRVRVGDGSDAPGCSASLPPGSIRPVGFASDEGMLEYDNRSFLGYRLLTEYFSFPEKFLFVDFGDIGTVVRRMKGGRLVIQCLIDRIPDTERYARLVGKIGPQHFRLGCVPIVNLFPQAAEPIRVTHQRTAYPVSPDSRKQSAFEVIQIQRVVRIERTGNGEHCDEVPPFYAIRRQGDEAVGRFYWHASREHATRPNDKGTDLQLHLVDANFQSVRPGAEVLSLDLLCSNRDLPEFIPFGGSSAALHTDFSLPKHPVVKRVKLLRKPTSSLRPRSRRGVQWRLISHLSLNFLSIANGGKAVLQELLSLYNLTDSAVINRQIQGIVEVTSKPAVSRVAGRDFSGFVRGTEISLTLDSDNYVGSSGYLFASVLERFFALYCAPNSFTRTRVRGAKQDEEIAAWPARSGEAIVI